MIRIRSRCRVTPRGGAWATVSGTAKRSGEGLDKRGGGPKGLRPLETPKS